MRLIDRFTRKVVLVIEVLVGLYILARWLAFFDHQNMNWMWEKD